MLTIYGDDSWFARTAGRVVNFMLEVVGLFPRFDAHDIFFYVKYDIFRIVQDLRVL